METIKEWDLSPTDSKFLNSKNARQGEKAIICSPVTKKPSQFNKDKDGNPIMDLMVDLKMEDGSVKSLRLNRASQKNLNKAGIKPDNCFGVEVMIYIFPVLVRGEMAKSVVIDVTGNRVDEVNLDGKEIKAENLPF